MSMQIARAVGIAGLIGAGAAFGIAAGQEEQTISDADKAVHARCIADAASCGEVGQWRTTLAVEQKIEDAQDKRAIGTGLAGLGGFFLAGTFATGGFRRRSPAPKA